MRTVRQVVFAMTRAWLRDRLTVSETEVNELAERAMTAWVQRSTCRSLVSDCAVMLRVEAWRIGEDFDGFAADL